MQACRHAGMHRHAAMPVHAGMCMCPTHMHTLPPPLLPPSTLVAAHPPPVYAPPGAYLQPRVQPRRISTVSRLCTVSTYGTSPIWRQVTEGKERGSERAFKWVGRWVGGWMDGSHGSAHVQHQPNLQAG